MVVIATLFAFVSCSGNFFTCGSVSSRPETSDSTTVDTGNKGLPSDVNFNISYVEADAIKPTSTTEVIAKVRPSVLELYRIVGQSKSSGSGVIVSFDNTDDNGTDDKALILTCHHVIENASQMTAKSIYGKEYKAELIGADPVSDFMFLIAFTISFTLSIASRSLRNANLGLYFGKSARISLPLAVGRYEYISSVTNGING